MEDYKDYYVDNEELLNADKNEIISKTTKAKEIFDQLSEEYAKNILPKSDFEKEKYDLFTAFEMKAYKAMDNLEMKGDDRRFYFDDITKKGYEAFKLNKDVLELKKNDPTIITVNNSDGTKKTFVLGLEEIKESTKEDIIKGQIQELKEYIKSNDVESIEAKNGNSYHKKIDVAELISKEVGNNNYSSNPEKLAEDLLLNVLKPLEIFNKYLEQKDNNKKEANKNDSKTSLKDELFYSVSLNNQEFKFKSYSDDFKNLIVEDNYGKTFEIENTKSLSFIISPQKEFNGAELNLLQNGKTLMLTDKGGLPFKVTCNQDNKMINFETVTAAEYLRNKKIYKPLDLKEKDSKTRANKLTNVSKL